MASAGELVIKIAADYATLVTGMGEAGAKVDAFGKKVTDVHAGMVRGFGMVRNAVAALGVALSVGSIVQYGEAVTKTVADMADMAENLKVTTDEFQAVQGAALLAGQSTEAVAGAFAKFNVFIGKAAEGSKEQVERLNELGIAILDVNGKVRPTPALLQEAATKLLAMEDGAKRAANEVAIFGKSGQAVSGILSEWAKGTAATNAELEKMGLKHAPEVVRQIDELDKKTAIAAKQMEVFFAPIYAAQKARLFEHFSEILKAFISDLDAIGAHSNIIDKIIALLQAFGKDGSAAAAAAFSTEQYAKAIDRLTTSTEHLEKAEANLARTARPGQPNPALDAIRDRLAAERSELALLKLQRDGSPDGGFTVPKPNRPGVSNPGVKGAGDSILEDIKKLEDAALAANSAIARMDSRRGEAWEDVQRNVTQQKEITEKVAELTRKAEAAGRGDLALRIADVARASIEAKNALKQYEQDATAADAATRKLGDGTEEYTKTLRDLNRQMATGRLSQVAMDRATKNASEKMKDQQADLDRFTGGWEGFSAGIDKAARDYAKANDEFSLGSKAFAGFVGLMDESLDILSGTSKKTFGEIASSFADMLAKMAMQAAASKVFEFLFSAAGSYFGGNSLPADVAGPVQPGIFGNIFGGGRAIGGGVDPGMSYWVGEHGPERFTPTAAGNISPTERSLNVIVNNNAPGVDVKTKRRPDGTTELTIEKVRAALSRDVARGGNMFANAIEGTYAIGRGGSAAK